MRLRVRSVRLLRSLTITVSNRLHLPGLLLLLRGCLLLLSPSLLHHLRLVSLSRSPLRQPVVLRRSLSAGALVIRRLVRVIRLATPTLLLVLSSLLLLRLMLMVFLLHLLLRTLLLLRGFPL